MEKLRDNWVTMSEVDLSELPDGTDVLFWCERNQSMWKTRITNGFLFLDNARCVPAALFDSFTHVMLAPERPGAKTSDEQSVKDYWYETGRKSILTELHQILAREDMLSKGDHQSRELSEARTAVQSVFEQLGEPIPPDDLRLSDMITKQLIPLICDKDLDL